MPKQKTVEDLWPGDVIVARPPGLAWGTACQVVRIDGDAERAMITLRARLSESTFTVPSPWNRGVEVVRHGDLRHAA